MNNLKIFYELKTYLNNEHIYHMDEHYRYSTDYFCYDNKLSMKYLIEESAFIKENFNIHQKIDSNDDIAQLKNDILNYLEKEHVYHNDKMCNEVREMYTDYKRPMALYFVHKKFINENRRLYKIIDSIDQE